MRRCKTGPYLSCFKVCSFPGVPRLRGKGESLLQLATAFSSGQVSLKPMGWVNHPLAPLLLRYTPER
jgi:hypothetical protein